MFSNILLVCVGNICRSPIAELLMRQALRGHEFEIGSAGLAALAGQPMDTTAAELLSWHGLDPSAHRARQLTLELLRRHELILAMEQAQLAQIGRLAPEAVGKVFLLDKWVASRDIPDPYRQPRGMFERVYAMIEQGVQAWLPRLQNPRQ